MTTSARHPARALAARDSRLTCRMGRGPAVEPRHPTLTSLPASTYQCLAKKARARHTPSRDPRRVQCRGDSAIPWAAALFLPVGEVANGLTIPHHRLDPVVLETVGQLAKNVEDVAEALG